MKKRLLNKIILATLLFTSILNAQTASILAKYDFDTTQDTSGNYQGTLNNGATLISYNNLGVLSLGNDDGYFDFGSSFGSIISQLENFSVSTNMMIANDYDINGNGNFVWTFANSTNMALTSNGNIFFGSKNSRYTISKTNYRAESTVGIQNQLPKGVWINLTYTQLNGIGKIYINGELKSEGEITINPNELGSTSFNFLGKSCYQNDQYLKKAKYDNFIIYQGALTTSEILSLTNELTPLNGVLNQEILTEALNTLEIPNANSVNTNLFLPSTIGENIKVTWSSSNPNVITNNGQITRPEIGSNAIKATLTATLEYNNDTQTKQIEVTILPLLSDAESVQKDLEELSIKGNVNNIRSNIYLPITTKEGTKIVWTSSHPEFISNTGKVLKLSETESGKQDVVLTATIIKGDEKANKNFNISIAEKENRSAYLFSYFTGNDAYGEQIRFAVSNDGYDYTPLNNGQPIINSDTISIKKGVRDPHILRGEDGNTFYMVVTDMKSGEGWSSNRGMVLLKSNDLVNWTHSTVHFPTKFPSTWSNVLRVWAPQTIYDPIEKKYMVYFSLFDNGPNASYDKIYYCYANEDFTDLIGEPKILFDRGTATIDGDIVYNEIDGLYHMFFKNESLGGISKVTSPTLTASSGQEPGSQWSEPSPRLQQTNKAVEGSGVFRLINTSDWVLMYDCYTSGHYQYCTSPNLNDFTFAKDNYNINARHGTTISISNEEAKRLTQKWPSNALSSTPQGARNTMIKKDGFNVNNTNKTINISTRYGIDIANFDPELYASPGTEILPQGPQDFSNGAINYTFKQNGNTNIYSVYVNIHANPVLPNFHADPDIMYSEKTGRFYIYPTTDGFPGWGSSSFNVFSSPDLVNWTDEGTILDLSTNQVSWAFGNAWAPSIIEKKVNNTYKYYYYYSGNTGSNKKIGVAVSDDPLGPFTDSGTPLISETPSGTGGQIIDGDIFNDPISGKDYLYWGNGFMAVSELNDDMISIKPNTTQVITPSGGNLNTHAYREGAHVFYREGIYYFLWSVDDTGSANYHVAYGTSTSPTGPINVANQPIVINQDSINKLYGTGHNSTIKIPGKDEWYIVYHRINKNYINTDPGTHREVCIDPLTFDENGAIIQVTPSQKGINPIFLDHENPNDLSIDDQLNQQNLKRIDRDVYNFLGIYIGKNIQSLKTGIYIIRDTYENGAVSVKKHFIK